METSIQALNRSKNQSGQRGFSLIEVVIIVLIIGILSSIAFASYINYRSKAYDASAQTAAVGVMKAQGVYYSDNQQYATNLDQLFAVDKNLTDTPSVTFVWLYADQSGYTMNVRHLNGTRWYTANGN